MEPYEYVKILQRRWSVVVASALVAMTAAWVTVPGGGPQRLWSATHMLYPTVSPEAQAAGQQVPIGFATMARVATTGQIPQRVAEVLGSGETAADLAIQVEVTADTETGSLLITSTQEDGARAALLADTFAAEIIRYFDERAAARREATIRGLEERLERQRQQIRELPSTESAREGSADSALLGTQQEALLTQHRADLTQHQQLLALGPANAGIGTLEAATPTQVVDSGFQPPSSPIGRISLAGLLGLLLGVGLALALERVDTRVRTRRGVENAFGLPIVTEIPRLPMSMRRRATIATLTHPASVAAEAFRLLRLALQLMPRYILEPPPLDNGPEQVNGDHARGHRRTVEGPAKVILITSAGAGEGKTSTLVNLAASFAEGGKRVYCLDCDIRHPRLHSYLGGESAPGVTDFLAVQHDHPASVLAALARPSAVPGVRIVPRGTPAESPGNLMAAGASLITAAAELADVVLVDAGPLLAVGDPAALAPHVDAVVVVARSGRTTAEEAHRTSELLARVQAPVLGVALVGVPRTSIGGRGYYEAPQSRPSEILRGLRSRVFEGREP